MIKYRGGSGSEKVYKPLPRRRWKPLRVFGTNARTVRVQYWLLNLKRIFMFALNAVTMKG
jgi:hypothetical protein